MSYFKQEFATSMARRLINRRDNFIYQATDFSIPGLFVPCCSVDVRAGPAYATPCRPCRGAADGDVAGDDECASAPHAGHSADGPQGPHSGSVEGLAHGERVLLSCIRVIATLIPPLEVSWVRVASGLHRLYVSMIYVLS